MMGRRWNSRTLYRITAIVLCLALVLQSSPLAAAARMPDRPMRPSATHRGPSKLPGLTVQAPKPVPNPAARMHPPAHFTPGPAFHDPLAEAGSALFRPVPVAVPGPGTGSMAAEPEPTVTPIAPAFWSAARASLVPPEMGPPDHEILHLAPDRAKRPPGLTSLLPALSLSLPAGWSLISIPEEIPATDPATVLSSIQGQFDLVLAYDACDLADPWKLYDPTAPVASDLTVIDHRIGFWIHMLTADTLTVSGSVPASTDIQICTGWNLIGYPLDRAFPVAGALHSIAGKYDRVFGHDTTDRTDPWAFFDVAAAPWANDLRLMQPGRGYWVLATEDVTATISGPDASPVVEITGPAEGTEITSPQNVAGTVASSTAATWKMQYRLKGDPAFTTFSNGDTSVNNDVTAPFDPTLLLNGIYEIRLTATDLFGQTAKAEVDVLVAGEMKVGLYTISFVDMNVAVAGLPITLIRTYDSRDKRKGDFGVGWTLAMRRGSYTNNRPPGDGWDITSGGGFLDPPCTFSNETKVHFTEIRLSDLDFYRFALQVQMFGFGSAISGGCLGTGAFTQIGGPLGATLRILDSTDAFWQNGSDQVLDFDTLAVYEPQRVRLTTPDGRQFDLTLADGLKRIRDRNDNTLTITNDGIIHSSGIGVIVDRDPENRISRITDPIGNSISYNYDASGDLVSVTDQEGYVTRFTYNSTHDLLDIIDARGVRASRNEYDADGRLIAVTDADGNRIELTHNLDTRQEVVRDRLGNVTVYAYDDRGNVISQTDPLGNTRAFTYDAQDNVLSETDPLGNTTTFTYDSQGSRLTETDPLGNVRRWVYDAFGNVTSETDATGATTLLVYDNNGNLLTREDPEGNVFSITYTSAGSLASYTNAESTVYTATHDVAGNILTDKHTLITFDGLIEANWQNTYDGNGNFRTITGPDGSEVTADVDARGFLIHSTDPLGNETGIEWNETQQLRTAQLPGGEHFEIEYDALGREAAMNLSCCGRIERSFDPEGQTLEVVWPNGNRIQNAWNALGQLNSTTGPLGNITRYTYDAAGNLASVEGPGGSVTTYERDSARRIVGVVDPEGNKTSFTRDGEGRITQTLFADGRSSVATFDGNGRMQTQTTRSGGNWAFEYSPMGHLISVVDPVGNATTYEHNTDGMVNQVIDSKGNITEMRFDTLGRLLRRTLPESQSEHIVYDTAGRLQTYTDYEGQTTSFAYNERGDLLLQTFPDGSVEQRTYDQVGKLVNVEDPRGLTIFTYDLMGHLVTLTGPDMMNVAYGYDSVGQVISVTTETGSTNFTHSPNGTIETMIDPADNLTRYTRDLLGRPIETVLPNGNLIQTTYDSIGNVTKITYITPEGQTMFGLTYTYDDAGRIAEILETTGRRVKYSYDTLDQLIEEHIAEANGSEETITYTYDAKGNLAGRTDLADIQIFVSDRNDRLLSDGIASYSWDDNGNLTSRTGFNTDESYRYDFLGRLVRFERTGTDPVIIEYEYDFDGLLSARTADGIRTIFIWDRVSSVLPQLFEQRLANGTPFLRYEHNDAFPLYVRNAAGDISYFITDHFGTVRAIASENGDVTEVSSFSAFGQNRGGSLPADIGFVGAYTDPDNDLVFMRSRWYAPHLARFIQPDQDSGNPFDTRTSNRFTYSFNDPVNRFDPTGQVTFTLSGLMAAVTIVATLAAIAVPYIPGGPELIARGLLGGLAFNPLSATVLGVGVTVAGGPAIPMLSVGGGFEVLQFTSGTIAGYLYIGGSFTFGAGTFNPNRLIDRVGAEINAGFVFNTPEPGEYAGPSFSVTLSTMTAKKALGLAGEFGGKLGTLFTMNSETMISISKSTSSNSHSVSKPWSFAPWAISRERVKPLTGFQSPPISIGISLSLYFQIFERSWGKVWDGMRL